MYRMTGRPRPIVTEDWKFFWDAVSESRLVVQRCAGCQVLRFPPLPICPECRSFEWDVAEMSGRGVIYSFVLPRAPILSYMPRDYVVALVELVEGPRMVTNIVEADPADLEIGTAVELCFEDLDDGTRLAQFRPASARAGVEG
jgi:uncharacterized OB-fold protein